MDNNLRKLSLGGLLIATSIVLTRFFAWDMVVGGLSVQRVSLGPVPLYLSGMMLGPIYGAIVGILADILGYMVKPLGGYFIGFSLNAALTGLIPGLIYGPKRNRDSKWLLSLLVVFTEILTSIVLTPLWLRIITGKAFVVFLPGNLMGRAILIPIYISLIMAIERYTKSAVLSLR